MRRSIAMFAMTFLALALVLPAVANAGGDHEYIGVKKCKMCHKGAYEKWEGGPHAGAFNTLASDEAKKAAAEKGIDDPQKSDECLGCHVTGHGKPAELLGKKWDQTEGVTCEGCHGFGSDYKSKKVMENREEAVANGLVIPTAENCQGCHNPKNPFHKEFDYDTYFAKIAHPEE